MKSEFQMQAETWNDGRAARAVIARVVDVLQVEGSEQSAPEMRRVVALHDEFAAIGERAIPQEKTAAAEREIETVIAGNSV
jgi:hypothetical protein